MAVVSLHGQPDITGQNGWCAASHETGFRLHADRWKPIQGRTNRDSAGQIGTPPASGWKWYYFAPQADGQPEENIGSSGRKTPGYENDEPDYEDEEIAGYMDGDDDTGRATGVSFDELGEAVRTANADNPTEAENSGKPPGHWQALRGRTSTMRWWRTSTAGWQRWRNCWDATKRNWLRLPSCRNWQYKARNTKRSTWTISYNIIM